MSLWFDNQGRVRAGWRFLLGVLVVVIANFIAIGVAGPLSHGKERLLEAVYRPLTMALVLAGYMLLLMSADQVQERLLEALGLGRVPGWRRQAAMGIAIGTAIIVVAVLWIAVSGDLRMISFSVNRHTLALAAAELFILATAAMAEELMFRSYPFQRLVEATGPVPATVVMSLLFGVAHGGNPSASKLAIGNTCAIGVLLCVAYLRTRALWMPWGIHFAWNTVLGLVFGLPVSGLTDFAVIVKTRVSGPRWVTGGSYGIEGSVVGTIVILLGFIPVVLLTRRDAGWLAEAVPVASNGGWDGQSTSDQPPSPRIQG